MKPLLQLWKHNKDHLFNLNVIKYIESHPYTNCYMFIDIVI